MTQRVLWILCVLGVLLGSYGSTRADDDAKCGVCETAREVCAQINDKLPRCDGCKEAKVPCAGCSLAKARDCADCKEAPCEACQKAKPACGLCAAKKQAVEGTFCCGDCQSADRAASCAKCKDMRAKVEAAAKQVGCAVCGGGKTETKDEVTATAAGQGRRVSVDRGMVLVVPGFYTYHVSIKNGTEANKTLKGRLTLLDAEGKEVGAGTLFQKLEPGQTVVKTYHWKASSPPADFKLEIEKIFN